MTSTNATPANSTDELKRQIIAKYPDPWAEAVDNATTARELADLTVQRMLPDVPQITFTISAITLQTIAANARVIIKNTHAHFQFLRLDINSDGTAHTTSTDTYRGLCERFAVKINSEQPEHTTTVHLALPLLEQIAARKIPKAEHQRAVTVTVTDHLTTIAWPGGETIAAVTAKDALVPHRDTFWPQRDDTTGPDGRTAARNSVWDPHLLADLAKLRHWNNGAKFDRVTLRIDGNTPTTAGNLKPDDTELATEAIRGAAVWTLQTGPGTDDTVQVAHMPIRARVDR